jgi:hypothetical protein
MAIRAMMSAKALNAVVLDDQATGQQRCDALGEKADRPGETAEQNLLHLGCPPLAVRRHVVSDLWEPIGTRPRT